jgi:PAS domain-containing protein
VADDRNQFQKEVERCIQGTRSVDFEFRIVRRDTGEVRWISSRTRLKRDGSVGYIIGARLDVTERRRAEEALRESEERFRLAAEAGSLGVWDYDAVLDERDWSDRLREIFGLSQDAPAQLSARTSSLDSAKGAERRRIA